MNYSPSTVQYPPGGLPPTAPHWPQHTAQAGYSPPPVAPYGGITPPVGGPFYPPTSGAAKPKRRSPPVEGPAVVPGQSSLTPAPGLPARPSFDLPNFNRQDMQRMHTGQAPPTGSPAARPHVRPELEEQKKMAPAGEWDVEAILKEAKDEFKKDQAAQAMQTANTVATPTSANQTPVPAAQDILQAPVTGTSAAQDAPNPKKKKTKASATKLVYSDNSTPPEEKMASWGKYAFKRSNDPVFVSGEVSGAVTGVAVGEDDVRDVQD